VKLYYFKTMNPRKACAAAKYLDVPVEYVQIRNPRAPEHLARDPNGRVPVLEDGGTTILESAAIMVHLSMKAGSDFWPSADPRRQVEVLRWISWDAFHFAPHAGSFYFENLIKTQFKLGRPDPAALEASVAPFHKAAKVLDTHLANHKYLVGDALSVADFVVAVLLPWAEEIELPVAEYANIGRWHADLMQLDAWRNPWPSA